MADQDDYKTLENKWPLTENQRGSPDLDAMLDIARKATLTRTEIETAAGTFFAASVTNTLNTGDINDRVIETADKYIIVESISVDINYADVRTGNFAVLIEVFASDSNRSTFSYVGGVSQQIGVPMNADYVNKLTDANFVFLTDATINGTSDYVIYQSSFFRESQGNAESVSGAESKFFDEGKRLMLSPNKQYLFRTTVTGDASGSAGVRTNFAFIEKEILEVS